MEIPRLDTEEEAIRRRLAHAEQQQRPCNSSGATATWAAKHEAALVAADAAAKLFPEARRVSLPLRTRPFDSKSIVASIPGSFPRVAALGELDLIRLELEERARRRSSSLTHRALGLGAAWSLRLYETPPGMRQANAYYGALSAQPSSSFQACPIIDEIFAQTQAHKAESRARAERIATQERHLSSRERMSLREQMVIQEKLHKGELIKLAVALQRPPPPPQHQPHRLAQTRLPRSSASTASGVLGGEAKVQASDAASTDHQSASSSTMLETGHPRLAAASQEPSTEAAVHELSIDNEEGQKEVPLQNSLFLTSDSIFLTEAQCFLRSFCIELFLSTDDHVCAPGKGARPGRAGQVGFRCVHCRDVQRCQQANQAVCYPFKRESIIESVRNFTRVHLNACPYIPGDVKARYAAIVKRGQLQQRPKRSQRLVRAYYAQAASEIGLVNTPRGLEYRSENDSRRVHGTQSKEMLSILMAAKAEDESHSGKDGKSRAREIHSSLPVLEYALTAATPNYSNDDAAVADQEGRCGKFNSVATAKTRRVLDEARQQATPFVRPSDFSTISDHTYLLFHQLLPCGPTSATAKRRRLNPDNLPRFLGLCCRYCHQNEGINGRYFPRNSNSLGDSSFCQTLGLHLATCQCVPQEIREALDELKLLEKEYTTRTKRGSKKAFIEQVWGRLEYFSKSNSGIIIDDHEDASSGSGDRD